MEQISPTAVNDRGSTEKGASVHTKKLKWRGATNHKGFKACVIW